MAFLIDANSTATSLMSAREHGPLAVSRHPDLPRTAHMHRSACYSLDVTRAVYMMVQPLAATSRLRRGKSAPTAVQQIGRAHV